MSVCNLLGNLDNKDYVSILGIIMMLKYGRIGFLSLENLRIAILFVSLSYVVAILFVNMFIFIYTAVILDFAILDIFLT